MDTEWSAVNGSLDMPEGWPIPSELAPAPDAALRAFRWRPDGGDPSEIAGRQEHMAGNYVTPVLFELEWPWTGEGDPELHVRYDKDVPNETVENDTRSFLAILGDPQDERGFVARFMATRHLASDGLMSRARKSDPWTYGPPVAATYRLVWDGPDPVAYGLRDTRSRVDWMGLELKEDGRSYLAELASRRFGEEDNTSKTAVGIRSDGLVTGIAANVNVTFDGHAQAVAALQRFRVPVRDLTVVNDESSSWCGPVN